MQCHRLRARPSYVGSEVIVQEVVAENSFYHVDGYRVRNQVSEDFNYSHGVESQYIGGIRSSRPMSVRSPRFSPAFLAAQRRAEIWSGCSGVGISGITTQRSSWRCWRAQAYSSSLIEPVFRICWLAVHVCVLGWSICGRICGDST